MATPSHLIRRGTIYYFRRKIPLHLREQIGKEEVRKSLGTEDLQEARLRAAAESLRLEQEFTRLRQERFARRQQARRAESAGEPPLSPMELFESWKGRRERPRTTVYDFAKAAQRFSTLHPGLGVALIEPAHMQAFRESLLAEGISAGTVRKQFGAMSAMLELAVAEGLLPDNPARGLRLPGSAGNPQKKVAFSVAELRAIFSTPIYRSGERPQGGAGQAAYWLPLLALYTGARLGELGALRTEDVREEAGIKYLDLLTEHARVPGARHRVPVHPDLVRLGFLQFVEMQRRARQRMLFEELRADNKGKLTGNWSKWFARYLRAVAKVGDPRKSFDSFRPSFAAACVRAALSQELQHALVGRGDSGQAARIPLPELARAVAALEFDIG